MHCTLSVFGLHERVGNQVGNPGLFNPQGKAVCSTGPERLWVEGFIYV